MPTVGHSSMHGPSDCGDHDRGSHGRENGDGQGVPGGKLELSDDDALLSQDIAPEQTGQTGAVGEREGAEVAAHGGREDLRSARSPARHTAAFMIRGSATTCVAWAKFGWRSMLVARMAMPMFMPARLQRKTDDW